MSGLLEEIVSPSSAQNAKSILGMKFMVLSDENCHERREASKFRNRLNSSKVYHCKDCKREVYLNGRNENNSLILHHIIPLLNGGTSNKNNLIILCNYCHNERHHLMKLKPELPLFRKRKVVGYSDGRVFTQVK